jgi:hypothetical protein
LTQSQSDRESKQLGLFTIVNFKNTECTAAAGTYKGLKGTCFSGTECDSKGGLKSGKCASGFGSCCVHVVKTDTATISHNCTYVQNSAYPTTKTAGAGTFAFSISPSQPTGICAIRFDFTDVVITHTAPLSATTDRLIIQGPTGGTTNGALPRGNPPLMAQDLSGQHIYVETGRSSTATTLKIVTLASTTGTYWRFKVSHIACDSLLLPPNGCMQYHLTDTGTIMSLSYQSTKTSSQQELASQQLSTCIRRNKGFCYVSYTPTLKTGAPSVPTATSFIVGATAHIYSTLAASNGCTLAAWVVTGALLPADGSHGYASAKDTFVGLTTGNALCGTGPSRMDTVGTTGNTVIGHTGVPIVQRPPFVTQHLTKSSHSTTGVEGYSIDYHQVGCTREG